MDTWAAPSVDSGLVAERTSGSLRSAETVALIPSAYLASVTFVPFGALSVTGAVPFAWSGSWASRRSVAFWLSVPGRLRLSLRSEPTLRAPKASAARTTIQTAEHDPAMAGARTAEAIQPSSHSELLQRIREPTNPTEGLHAR